MFLAVFATCLIATTMHAEAPSAGIVLIAGGGEADAKYQYRLVEPPAEQLKDGGRVPLIVFLHGSGERGSDNQSQMKHFVNGAASAEFQSKHPCYVLAVQCPSEERWIDIPKAEDGKPNWSANVSTRSEATRAMRAVQAAMTVVMRDKAVDLNRVYLTGLSMGGFGALDLAVRSPQLFAAVVCVCGGGDVARAGSLRGVPVLLAHGVDDPVVPVKCSRLMAEALRQVGAEVVIREYPKVGHEAWTKAYTFDSDGALGWMFAQRKAAQK